RARARRAARQRAALREQPAAAQRGRQDEVVLMAPISGGRAVVELLKAEGVRYVFGIVGSTFLDVLDTLYDDRSIEYVNVRHEQAAAFMADGLARVTGLPSAMKAEIGRAHV